MLKDLISAPQLHFISHTEKKYPPRNMDRRSVFSVVVPRC